MKTKMRYPVKGKRYYDVEILTLSGDYHSLQADAQKLADYELTKEKFLGCAVTSSSSSEPDHVTSDATIAKPLPKTKKTNTPKSVPPKKKKGSAEREEEIKLALQKAKYMDSRASMMDITNSTEVEKQTTLAVDKEKQTAERRERQSKKKSENQPTSAANFTSTDKSNVTYVSRYDYDQYNYDQYNYGSYENDSDSYWNAQNYLDDSYYEEEYNHPYTDYSGYNTSSPFPGSGAPVHYDCWSNLSSSSGMGNLSSSSSCSSTTGAFKCSTSSLSSSSASTSSRAPKHYFTENSTSAKRLHMESTAFKKELPPPIELVEGYGVFITRRALDDAVDSCRHTATRLMRNLVGVFFSDDILSRSNACGGGKKDNIALDQDVLGACYKFVLNKFPSTAKTDLKDAVNDCCCNARRKIKRQ